MDPMGSVLIIPKDRIVCPEVPGISPALQKKPGDGDFSTINPTVLGISGLDS